MNIPEFSAHLALTTQRRRYLTGYSSLREHHDKLAFIPALAGTACPTEAQNAVCPTLVNVADAFPCGIFFYGGEMLKDGNPVFMHTCPHSVGIAHFTQNELYLLSLNVKYTLNCKKSQGCLQRG